MPGPHLLELQNMNTEALKDDKSWGFYIQHKSYQPTEKAKLSKVLIKR